MNKEITEKEKRMKEEKRGKIKMNYILKWPIFCILIDKCSWFIFPESLHNSSYFFKS